eukprot:scaffold1318_cov388-Prasinococcus_capsulatus_cf.AAC.14
MFYSTACQFTFAVKDCGMTATCEELRQPSGPHRRDPCPCKAGSSPPFPSWDPFNTAAKSAYCSKMQSTGFLPVAALTQLFLMIQ